MKPINHLTFDIGYLTLDYYLCVAEVVACFSSSDFRKSWTILKSPFGGTKTNAPPYSPGGGTTKTLFPFPKLPKTKFSVFSSFLNILYKSKNLSFGKSVSKLSPKVSINPKTFPGLAKVFKDNTFSLKAWITSCCLLDLAKSDPSPFNPCLALTYFKAVSPSI